MAHFGTTTASSDGTGSACDCEPRHGALDGDLVDRLVETANRFADLLDPFVMLLTAAVQGATIWRLAQ
jgi:hypothetical protein